jgi:hypothetical protein
VQKFVIDPPMKLGARVIPKHIIIETPGGTTGNDDAIVVGAHRDADTVGGWV